MLAYLEALCSALKGRDAARIEELLRHPLASALPDAVADEARRIAAPHAGHIAPLHTLRLYHQTAHLLGVCSDPAMRRQQGTPPRRTVAERPRQIELELPYHAAVA